MRRLFGLLLVTGFIALGYAAWRYVGSRSHQECRACLRPIHAHSKTIAVAGGRRDVYCCPTCALSEQQQTGRPVEVVELADYAGSGPLRPGESWVVRGSDVNPCMEPRAAVGPDKRPLHIHYDRCAPSILAFRDRQSADQFSARHGGHVLRFGEIHSGDAKP